MFLKLTLVDGSSRTVEFDATSTITVQGPHEFGAWSEVATVETVALAAVEAPVEPEAAVEESVEAPADPPTAETVTTTDGSAEQSTPSTSTEPAPAPEAA